MAGFARKLRIDAGWIERSDTHYVRFGTNARNKQRRLGIASLDPSYITLPRPARGERVGVRGRQSESGDYTFPHHPFGSLRTHHRIRKDPVGFRYVPCCTRNASASQPDDGQKRGFSRFGSGAAGSGYYVPIANARHASVDIASGSCFFPAAARLPSMRSYSRRASARSRIWHAMSANMKSLPSSAAGFRVS
jgi:hypothetical protein